MVSEKKKQENLKEFLPKYKLLLLPFFTFPVLGMMAAFYLIWRDQPKYMELIIGAMVISTLLYSVSLIYMWRLIEKMVKANREKVNST